MTHNHRLLLALALILGLLAPAQAAITVTRMEGFNKTWQFVNTDPVYNNYSAAYGYYMDYNKDGLSDFLILQRDRTGNKLRLFTLNTAPSKTDKTYAKDKTAGRDFPPVNGGASYIHVATVRSPRMEAPDLVVYNDNGSSPYSYEFTKETFQRLKKTDKTWPTEATWTNMLPFSGDWLVEWLDVSLDDDDYPDYFIFNCVTTIANRKFVLGLYSGRNGKQIWQKTLALASDDTVTSGPGQPSSSLYVRVLPMLPVKEFGNADFDNDGKPEILLHYNYVTSGSKSSSEPKARTCIKLLNANGTAISPQGNAWTTVSPPEGTEYADITANSDLDRDGYRDLLLMSYNTTSYLNPGPLYQGFSLKKREILFKSNMADFGSELADLADYWPGEMRNTKTGAPADVTGDGWPDLSVYRSKVSFTTLDGKQTSYPTSIGLFNAYGSKPGRKVWIKSFPEFDHIVPCVNDFNYDGIDDCLLIKNPTSPSQPTWTLVNAAVTRKGITLGKPLTYTVNAKGVRTFPNQTFHANAQRAYSAGDVDGNGQCDTMVSLSWILYGQPDQGGGSLIIYNTPPPSSSKAPNVVAAMDVKVTGNISVFSSYLTMCSTLNMNQYGFVDNNRNGVNDDALVINNETIFALSFKKKGSYPAAGQAQTPSPASGGQVQVNRPLIWEPSDGNLAPSAYDIYLGTSLSAVGKATHASPEYRGNLAAPSYLPRPALTANSSYYWRIDTINPWGKATKGKVWILKATR